MKDAQRVGESSQTVKATIAAALIAGVLEKLGATSGVLKTHRFISGEDLEQTLMRYVALYNHQLPLSTLKSRTPMRAMKDWYASHPHLFVKRPYDHPGCDTYMGSVKILAIQPSSDIHTNSGQLEPRRPR